MWFWPRFLALFLLYQPAGASEDVTLLRNDAEAISVRYRKGDTSWRQSQIEEREYSTPIVQGAGVNWPAGAPQLPTRVIWLAVPPGSVPILASLIPYSTSSLSGLPEPVPTETPQPGGSTIRTYTEDPAFYASHTPFPASWAEMQGPQSYRDLTVVRIAIYPFRFSSSTGGLLSMDSVDVQIRIQGGSGSFSGAPVRPLEDEYYQDLIVNWQGPVKSWKQPRQAMAELTDPWPTGDLYKIKIDASGMYRLTYADLVNAGINLEGLDPHTLRIFNNGGEVLPKNLNVPRPQGPIENAILIQGEDDDRFDPGDEIWFYGKAVHEWKWNASTRRFQHYRNPYTDLDVYWLNVNRDSNAPAGKRMSSLGLSGSYHLNPITTRAYYYDEKEIYVTYDQYNLPTQMPDFWGDTFFGTASRSYNFNFENVDVSSTGVLVLKFLFTGSNTFKVYLNNNNFYTTSNSSSNVTIPVGLLQSGTNTLRLEHSSNGSAYLDYFELEYTRTLATNTGKLNFFSPKANGEALYNLSASGLSSPWIFDVSSFADVKSIHAATFIDLSDTTLPRRYIALNANALSAPLSIIKDQRSGEEYANLYSTLGADELLICGDEFYEAASELESYRETQAPTPMDVMRVRVSDIFDDFGWGLVDPAAIRDFLKTTLPPYNWAVSPLYVLFVGDGDFDYKNRLNNNDANWVIPFVAGGRCTDDWYAYFQPTDNNQCYPELALGRWPVQSSGELQTLITRLVEYETGNHYGPWQDIMTFVADDEHHAEQGHYERDHIEDTEYLAEHYVPRYMNLDKIYLTEYPSSWDPIGGGLIKPGATADLIAGINEGRLLVNFVGHGNPTVWADERTFLQNRDLPLLNNGSKLPLFIAATCDWAYWDSPFDQSMPEAMMTLPGGGAIASIAATRTTTGDSNRDFLYKLYQEFFSQPGGRRLGEALMRAKASFYNHSIYSPSNYNNEKYHLLGDPVMKLAIPELSVYLDSTAEDTLSALQRVTLTGDIRTAGGTPVSSFQGIAHLKVFDTRTQISYQMNNNPLPIYTLTYILSGNAIFRGDCSVENGQFTTTFIVPVDMSYGGPGGRYSIYAYPGESSLGTYATAAGADTTVYFSQSATALQDTIAPTLSLYFNSPAFRSGDTVSPTAILYVQVADSNGINLTGSTGHGITVTVDDQQPIDMTEAFNYDLNSCTTGRAQYQFLSGQLSPGTHSVQAIAWDAANNPAGVQASVNVAASGQMVLSDVLNYPNPMKNTTRFTFTLSDPAEISIKIYTVAGRLIKSLEGGYVSDYFDYDNPLLVWDGRDEQGDAISNGLYLYKVTAQGAYDKAEKIGKLMVLR
jgi:hypothetical protein